MGNILDEPLKAAVGRYRRGALGLALGHAESVRTRLQKERQWPFVSWYANLAAS